MNISARDGLRGEKTHLLQLLLAFLEVKVLPNDGILPRELHDLLAVEVIEQTRVDLTRELPHGVYLSMGADASRDEFVCL